jgi:hypothetical protein
MVDSPSTAVPLTGVQHGRVKVRTTEEQQEIKRKQRAEKLAKFLQVKKLLFHKVLSDPHATPLYTCHTEGKWRCEP